MDSKSAKIANFNPNGSGLNNGQLFGLPFDYDESKVIVIPVPWDVTTSYHSGTANGPACILAASRQLDLYDKEVKDAWKIGIHLLPIDKKWLARNEDLRFRAKTYIDFLEQGKLLTEHKGMVLIQEEINATCTELKQWVKVQALAALAKKKVVGVLGGEHSVPLGLLEALTEHHAEFGILQIDAHADLRKAYQGLTHSHASIMYNALQYPQITKLITVGVRDICAAEATLAQESKGRVNLLFDEDIKESIHLRRKVTWANFAKKTIKQLPKKVYISFDIDGLDPKLCPNTGTPVPGGLALHEAFFLIKEVINSGREIIGFDLCEVAPSSNKDNDWDANVGARILYKLGSLVGQ